MLSHPSQPVHNNDGRRIYVFATVALATFLLGIVVVGYAGHGFATSPGEAAAEIVAQEAAAETARQQAAEDAAAQAAAEAAVEASRQKHLAELQTSEAAADREYQAAHQASADALTQYEGAQSKFLDFVGAHFGELTADIPTAKTYTSELAEYAAKERERAEQAAAKERELAAKAAELAAARANPPKPVQKPAPKIMVANPEWTQLREQLEQLQQQRKNLLDKLTPSHPAVATLDLDISDVEQKLQTVPAQVAGSGEPAETEQQAAAAEEKPAVAEAPSAAEEVEKPQPQQFAVVPPPAVDLAAWAARWGTDDASFHELSDRLSATQTKYREALEKENTARQRQLDAATAVATVPPAATPTPPPAPVVAPPVIESTANPRRTIWWCGALAAVMGLIAAQRAGVTEPVFRAASAVRQSLGLPVLGLLSRGPSQLPREQPQREPRWVRRTVLTAELWLVAVVLLLAATAVADQQFWRDLIADPLAACSSRFF